jgi:hypothetical protein
MDKEKKNGKQEEKDRESRNKKWRKIKEKRRGRRRMGM